MDARTIGAAAPGLATTETAAGLCPVLVASVAADAVKPVGLSSHLNATNPSAATRSPERKQDPGSHFGNKQIDKELATLKARFAMRGYALYQLEGKAYLVIRWNLSRSCADVDDVRRFLALVEETR